MPEIAEVARVVHYLRKHLVNRVIKTCQAFEDDIVYGKVGTSASAFQKAVQGRTVTGAGQQGKYFYITFDRPPHAVCHLGMTGWVKFNSEETLYYRQAKKKGETEEWPPKYMKFLLKCDAEKVNGEARDAVEVAFVDARRLARVRLVDCEAAQIRKTSPLVENGPDPVIDREILTVDWLKALLARKKSPIKAVLLDQANISGVGNWVADEVLYQARLHPEQFSNTFNQDQVQRLHDALMYVCTTACDLLADSERFPETWLMKYRWNKGKKDSNTLPNGDKIVHLTVGGRTSAIVPAVQKKTAAVAGDVEPKALEEALEASPAGSRKRKVKTEDEAEEGDLKPTTKARTKRVKAEESADGENDAQAAPSKRASRGKAVAPERPPLKEAQAQVKSTLASVSKVVKKAATIVKDKVVTPASRRSSRGRGQ